MDNKYYGVIRKIRDNFYRVSLRQGICEELLNFYHSYEEAYEAADYYSDHDAEVIDLTDESK